MIAHEKLPMKTLIVLLPTSMADAQQRLSTWLPESEAVHTFTLAQLVAQRPTRLLLLVPMPLLAWQNVELPAQLPLGVDARLPALLQNLLEENLLGEASQAHIALAPDAQAGQRSVVAVLDYAWLAGWLALFERQRLAVHKVLPQLPPEQCTQPVCTGDATQAWVTAQIDGAPLTLPLQPAALALLPAGTAQALPAAWEQARACWPQESLALLAPQKWLTALLESRWDLAQHQLAGGALQRNKRRLIAGVQDFLGAPSWRAARAGAMALGLVLVLGVNAQWWWQKQLLQQRQQAIVATAQQTFAQLRVVVDAPVQMQRELARLRQERGLLGPRDLESLLAAAGAAWQGLASPSAVEFKDGQLTLRGTWQDQDVATVQERLADLGYRIESDGQGGMVIQERMPVQESSWR